MQTLHTSSLELIYTEKVHGIKIKGSFGTLFFFAGTIGVLLTPQKKLTPTRVDVSDVAVEYGAPVNGKRQEIPFPRGCAVTSVRRRCQVFIPHGDTMLHAGMCWWLWRKAWREEVIALCQREDSSSL